MRGATPPLSHYVFMAWYLLKHRYFTFFTLLYSKYKKVSIGTTVCTAVTNQF